MEQGVAFKNIITLKDGLLEEKIVKYINFSLSVKQ